MRTTNILTSVFALGVGLAANGAAAQDAAEETEELEFEEIITTGTLIKGIDLEGAVQAIQLNRDDILESGAGSIADLMRDLTVTGGGAGTFSTSTGGALSGDTPPGASGVSLRGLGTSATLTLINGRRASIASFANGQESFIDVSSIPFAAIERIEILPNGASATYGADAVAGVINYVLRDDFEGVEISGSYGNSTKGSDDSKVNVNAVWGANFGRHNVMVIADYFNRAALHDRDRAISKDSVRPSQQGFYPSFNDLFFMYYDQTEGPAAGGCAEEDFGFGNFGDFCEVDTNDFTSVHDQLESYGTTFTHKFEASDQLTFFNEFMFQRTETSGTSSPANFSRAPVDPENPYWPEALQADMVEEASFSPDWPSGAGFDWFNGYPIFAWGKFPEPRAISATSETFRLVSGFEYEFENGWNMESAFTYGQNKSRHEGKSGLVISEAFYNANLGNLCSDGSTVNRWSVDLQRPSASYVGETCEDQGKTTLWYNPFGGQADQAEGVDDAIRTGAVRRGKSHMWSFDTVFSGPLFELGGYEVQSAFGFEYRNEKLRDTPSGVALATADNPNPILGFSSTSAFAKRDQWALFGEFFVPITDNFELQLAGRYEDSSDYGSDFNPKVAFRYQPVESLIFRGNWSTSFRAPSLAQSGAGTLLSSYRVDCVMTPDACGGDAAADGEGLLSEDVGNPNLKPEQAETWGLGMLFRPNRDIELNVDYWNIRHEDLVGIDEDDFIRRALAGEFPVLGAGELANGVAGLEVTDGFVTDAHFELSNLGYQKTSGIDVSYTQYMDIGEGTLSFLFDLTYLIEFDRKSSVNAPEIDEVGEYRFPQILADARLRYRQGPWRFAVSANFTDSYKDDPTPRVLEAAGLADGAEVTVPSWTVFNAGVGYDLNDNTSLQFNVDNVFDKAPPRVLGTSANVDHINHDSMGRFVSLRITKRF
ncbi:MAG: TonB-dependent receptor [Alphaproteobacteria bacterium]|nr:TonB-dependent receptor [Alphaproteobacteria bacterium]